MTSKCIILMEETVLGRVQLATNEVYMSTTNEKITSTEWHLVVRNKAAEICELV
jgi:hypothetical protein